MALFEEKKKCVFALQNKSPEKAKNSTKTDFRVSKMTPRGASWK